MEIEQKIPLERTFDATLREQLSIHGYRWNTIIRADLTDKGKRYRRMSILLIVFQFKNITREAKLFFSS